jgi:hypothetical protein
MKWVHDFAKRDGKIKDYDRSPWFIQEFDFYEELKGL